MNAQPLRLAVEQNASAALTIWVDGQPVDAQSGETIAAALYAAGIRAWRTARNGEARGLLCGMGVCYDCLVAVDGGPAVRACQEEVRAGMRIETGRARAEAE